MCCLVNVCNLSVPIVTMFSKSFHCILSSSLGLSTNTLLKILDEEFNKASIFISLLDAAKCILFDFYQ